MFDAASERMGHKVSVLIMWQALNQAKQRDYVCSNLQAADTVVIQWVAGFKRHGSLLLG